MPSNFTEHYNLSQWERTDKIQMEDFNEDNAKIDGAIKAEADARTAADAAINAALACKGNCRVALTSYTGNGQYGQSSPTSIYFSGRPLACILACGGRGFAVLAYGASMAAGGMVGISGGDLFRSELNLSWSGSRVSFWQNDARRQFNEEGQTYYVLTFYSAD